ncbi:PQQ-binding-like beta-propeller repeat protein [soil metagenome]
MDRFKLRSFGNRLESVGLPWAVILTGLIGWSITAEAQIGPGRGGGSVYPETSSFAESLLLNARFHEENEQWASAVELYRRVIRQYGEMVTPLPATELDDPMDGFRLYINVRELCQRRIARLPAEGLRIYRQQVDGEAEHWYRRGLQDRDPAPLRRVVTEAFCSSWGDEALELLGDLSFQEGRFADALAAYRALVPDQPEDPGILVYPDPTVDLARISAKKLLVRAAAGENPPQADDLQEFAQTYPDAKGSLAGRDEAPLVEILAEALKLDGLAPPISRDGRWPTFAGAPNRSKVATEPIDIGSLQWVIPLERPTESADSRLTASVRLPAMAQETPEVDVPIYHPIILGDEVLVSDHYRIQSFELTARPEREGGAIEPTWIGGDPAGMAMAQARSIGAPRFTLTAQGNRIFARMGSFGTVYRNRNNMAPISSIVAIERSSQGKFLWKRSSDEFTLPNQGEQEESGAGFGGTPVADEHNVYVALLQPGPRAMTWVACLDAETGATRWVRYICAASSNALENRGGFRGGLVFNPDLGHRLLSLHGSTLYYQTDLGAVAAIETRSGNLRWLASYPRNEEALRRGGQRDLNPAVVHDGRVIVAPRDSDRIFAFDTESGRPLWQANPGAKVTHLLGVAKGRIVVTGDHVWTFDAKTGETLSRWPDGQTFEEGYGRGLLADAAIYWPTRDKIYILDQETGLPARRPPISLREFGTGGGNLVAGDGYLVVAQANRLVVFCKNETLIRRYSDQIAEAPEDPSNYFRLAQVAEATGDHQLALASLVHAIDRAKPSDRIDGERLVEVAQGHRYRLQLKVGRDAEANEDWTRAAELFAEAAGSAPTDEARLEARLAQARAEANDDRPADAVATLQKLLADDRLRPLSVAADANRTVRAELLIADRIGDLLDRRGRELYAEYDLAASALLARGIKEEAPHLLGEVERLYPLAAVVPEALLSLGRFLERQDRPAEAGRAYKRLLARADDDQYRALGLLGLARTYETQRLWVPARDTYERLAARYSLLDLEDEHEILDGTLRDHIASRLAQGPLGRIGEGRTGALLSPPLTRGWELRWSGVARPLLAEGVPPSPESSRIFLAEGSELRSIDTEAGAIFWATDLGGAPVWVGYLADRVVAATEQSIVALDLTSGEVVWRYRLEDAEAADSGLDPFTPPKPDNKRASGKFHDFLMIGDRIYCQRGDRELMAFDGDAGLPEWTFSPPLGRLNPRVGIGPDRIVLQVLDPESILVLHTETGRPIAEFPQPGSTVPWARDPFPVADDRVVLVLDPRTIALLDLRRGEWVWRYREVTPLPRYDPPRLLGDADRLLVLSPEGLARLDPANGSLLWSTPLGHAEPGRRPGSVTLDAERLYWIGRNDPVTLHAIDLESGQSAWQRPLAAGPSGPWSITLADASIVAFPSPDPAGSSGRNALPLVLCRRDTGGLMQRIVLSTTAADVAVRLAPKGALIATRDGLWSLDSRRTMDAEAGPR